jgi:hypothetical protein
MGGDFFYGTGDRSEVKEDLDHPGAALYFKGMV